MACHINKMSDDNLPQELAKDSDYLFDRFPDFWLSIGKRTGITDQMITKVLKEHFHVPLKRKGIRSRWTVLDRRKMLFDRLITREFQLGEIYQRLESKNFACLAQIITRFKSDPINKKQGLKFLRCVIDQDILYALFYSTVQASLEMFSNYKVEELENMPKWTEIESKMEEGQIKEPIKAQFLSVDFDIGFIELAIQHKITLEDLRCMLLEESNNDNAFQLMPVKTNTKRKYQCISLKQKYNREIRLDTDNTKYQAIIPDFIKNRIPIKDCMMKTN